MKREDFQPSKWSTICSEHFEEECFINTPFYRLLKDNSIPTIFTANLPSELQDRRKQKFCKNVFLDHNYSLPSEAELYVKSQELKEESKTICLDHNYSLPSQKELDARNKRLIRKHKKLKKKFKAENQAKTNALKKCSSFQEVINDLQEKNLISETVEELLQKTTSKVPSQLFERLANSNQKSKKFQRKYTKELKSFAITLQFYSSKGYNYVRNTFGLCLPHENVVRKWYSTVGAEPGFANDAFVTLRKKVEEEKEGNKSVTVSLTFDEVAIKKKIEWTGKKFIGHVDLGTGIEPEDSSPLATEALVFMIVALDGSWKLSIGYFLIASLNAEEKFNILKIAFQKLHDVGVKTVNVTCDGLAANISTLRKFGISFDPTCFQCSFPHPSDPTQKITVMLDACHLLKLARNTLSDLKVLIDPDGKQIKWDFVEKLHNIQTEEGLRAGNKIRQDHISWRRQKMKVNLAAQTLSSSVADSIDFCRESLKLKEFHESEATSKFIRMIDRLFDTMNSRNALAKGFKAALRKSNKGQWEKVFDESLEYLSNLTDLKGTKLIHSPRKTAFIGFLLNIHSLKSLFKTLVEDGDMKYILTYKLSQDHLELFFSALRCRLGCNNNPSCKEFKAAYKRLLVHQEIRGNRGNCLLQDDTTLLTFQKSNKSPNQEQFNDFATQKKFGLSFDETDHDYAQVSSFPELSEFQSSVIEYIAGYTVRMAEKIIKCETCLSTVKEQKSDSAYALVRTKDKGGLIYSSYSVVVVCKTTEQALKTVLKTTAGIVTFKNDLCLAITSKVLQNVLERYP